MRSLPTLLLLTALPATAQPVTNIVVTDAEVEQVLRGQYDPAIYAASSPITDHATMLCEMRHALDADSLRAALEVLEGFHTRHSYSDTVSDTQGIGAARRWAFAHFARTGQANEGRLLPAFLQFDWPNGSCGDAFGWRNVLAVLPGSDPADHQLVLIEAHLDSRCAGDCDVDCPAPGMEDNGSGSALVLELARVMSRYSFRHTVVFMLTTGEEQGLVGAEAMAQWCAQEGIAIKAVQNNDIVGGVLCGQTSSAPSCAPPGSVDSLRVRLFASGSIATPHRTFARTVRLLYEEKLQDQMAVPMAVEVMDREDRDGRGGDHIPFRAQGFRNVRFTSANEHGSAVVDSAWYTDHQHTSDDVLGVDTDGDLEVDSFFVDFNYLQRNTLINGMAAVLMALGPAEPEFVVHDEPAGLRVSFTPASGHMAYRIGVRRTNSGPDFDAVYRTADTSFLVPGLTGGLAYAISVAVVDSNGVMSPFTREQVKGNDADTPPQPADDLPYGISCWGIGVPEPAAQAAWTWLSPPVPDPFPQEALFTVHAPQSLSTRTEAYLLIRAVDGRAIGRMPLRLSPGRTDVHYHHAGAAGAHTASLVVDGRVVATERFVVVR